jgi:hypothetical protein
MWALYCLVQFYYATKHELHEIHPLSKFLCFKAVVFVTWWQGVVIALLFATGVAVKWLPGHPSKKQTDMLQTNLQDFIICIEVNKLRTNMTYKEPSFHSVSLFTNSCLPTITIEHFLHAMFHRYVPAESCLIEILLSVQMAFAAVAHIYVYPAAPYRRESHNNLNRIDSVADELEEDIEVAATSVKESVKDVLMGGGEDVSALCRRTGPHSNILMGLLLYMDYL